MQELEEWHTLISSFKELSLEEAQSLYRKALETKDINLINQVILGTLHQVYKYMKKNYSLTINSPSFDINELISTLTENWVRIINEGELLRVKSYKELFQSKFHNNVYETLGGYKDHTLEHFGIEEGLFEDYLYKYIRLRNNKQSISTTIIFDKNCKDPNIQNQILSLFDKIYTHLSNEYEKVTISKDKLREYLRIIYEDLFTQHIVEDIKDDTDYKGDILDRMYTEQFIKDLDSVLKDSDLRNYIHKRYGLDNEDPLSMEEISIKYNIPYNKVEELEKKANGYLLRSKKMKGYNKNR